MNTETSRLEELKSLIDSSEIFDISKDAEPVRYRNLEYNLVSHLYEYAQLLSSSRYKDMGLEIVETAIECLHHYDRNRGAFTNYFSLSLARRVNKAKSIQNASAIRGGIALPEKIQKQITTIQWIAGKMMRDIEDEKVLSAAANYLEISVEQVREIVRINSQYTVIRSNPSNASTVNLFDIIPDAFDLEGCILEKANLNEIFDAVEVCFKHCRKSQQEVVSKYLTIRLLSCSPDVIQLALHRIFFNYQIYDYYLRTGNILSAREVSRQLNKNEASTSRTFSRFIKRVKDYYIDKLRHKEELP